MRTGILIISLIFVNAVFSQDEAFKKVLNDTDWNLKFEDSCTSNWQEHWFIDGLRANVKNTNQGMVFSAGNVEGNHACHAVLWTKKSFTGDVKIEYDYTRIDTRVSQVNILYVQATGVAPNKEDIYLWKEERNIPYMRSYFDTMKCLHISYAAFGKEGEYVRARKYPRPKGKDFNTTTEIPKASFNTGLFEPGVTYKITVIKTKDTLYFYVDGKQVSKLFNWDLSSVLPVNKGRIGLRHMFTRSSLYRNFKVYTK